MSFNNKAETDPLLAWMDAGNQQPLRNAGDAEVEVSLRRLLDEQEAMAEAFDSERLMRAAWAMENAEKWSGPDIAVSWLKERPCHTRLGIVLSLLMVAWNCKPGMPRPAPVLVETLLSVYDGLDYDLISENTLLLVLMVASKSGLPVPLVTRVREIIQHARNASPRQPEVRAQLDNFLNATRD